MFDKPLNKLVKADLHRLLDEKVIEGIDIEFKQSLPSKRGNDPWIEGKDKIGDYARNEILEEIVAFANAYGGVICIGIIESDDTPAYAREINEIPKCKELAERLKLQCRDCIDPQIPLLEASGVDTDESGGGVVVIQIPQSRLAPHRHTITKECYIRRADRSEKMMMREIQDLTLHTERGMARINDYFNDQKSKFEEKLKTVRIDMLHKIYGIRITALPTSDIYLNDIHSCTEVKSNILRFTGTFDGRTKIDLNFPFNGDGWRPILRGTYNESGNYKDYFFSTELQNNGLIELVFIFNEGKDGHIIYINWFMGMVCNTLNYLHGIRKAAGTPSVEYALEIQLMNIGDPLYMYGYHGHGLRPLGTIRESNVIFPRYSVGTADIFQQLSNVAETDFWNHFGMETSGINIQINFDELIQ